MCGCTKNKNLKAMLSGHGGVLKTADELIAEGVAGWYKYNGPIATRLGHATGTRYAVNPAKCALLSLEDYAWFEKNRPGMFTPCPEEMVGYRITGKVKPGTDEEAITKTVDPTIDLNESTDELDVKAETKSSIVNITTLTVNEALPIIREASEYSLDVWVEQENERPQGPRQMIFTAIEKRYQEIKVEAKG